MFLIDVATFDLRLLPVLVADLSVEEMFFGLMFFVLLTNGLSDFVVEDAIILDECVLAMLIIPMKLKVDQEVCFVCGSTTTLGIGEEGQLDCQYRLDLA